MALKYLIPFVFLMLCACAIAVEPQPQVELTASVPSLDEQMQTKVSVDFRNTPIEDVIKIMAAQAGVDMVKSPSVEGNVTATLTNVPLDEALDNILAAHKYGYVRSKNMIRIAPLEELEQAAEKLEKDAEKPEPLVNKIYRITYADIAEVELALEKFISNRGSLSANFGTSNIIVTDTESKIKAIDDFINELDRITPQVMVEVRIYDITSKDRFDLGVEWQAGRTSNYGTGDITGLGTNPTGIINPFATGIFEGAVSKTSGTTGALRLGWLNSSLDIDILLHAQQENVNAKLLANPRILVLDNEVATIKIISEIPYQEVTESSDGGSIGSTAFRDVGVELEVLPHVTRQEMIRLNLKPKFSVKTDDVTVGTGTNNTFSQPVVDRREADTTLLIKSGQTVVLGGLRKKEVSMQTNKIPFLGDLPMVGNLFKCEGEDTVTSELVVFITPWIVENPTLSETEQKQYNETEFKGPKISYTRAEEDPDEKTSKDKD